MKTTRIRTIALAFAALLAAWAPQLPADESAPGADTIEVVVSGSGLDEASARQQALSNAVQQAVGTIVDATTVVDNDKIITDQILTASNGMVTRAEQVGAPQKSNGLVTVKIHAWVQQKELRARLAKANVKTMAVDPKQLAAAGDSAAIVHKVFEDFPGNVLKAEPIGSPTVTAQTAEEATVVVKVRFSIDDEKYAAWVKDSLPKLKGAAERWETFRWNPGDVCKPLSTNVAIGKEGKDVPMIIMGWPSGVTIPWADVRQGYRLEEATPMPGPKPSWDENCLMVFERTRTTPVTLLHVSQPAYAEVAKATFSVPVVDVLLKDAAGTEIDSHRQAVVFRKINAIGGTASPFVRLRRWECTDPGASGRQLNDEPPPGEVQGFKGAVGVLPYMRVYWGLSPSFTFDFTFKLSPDQLKTMKSVEARISSINVGKKKGG